MIIASQKRKENIAEYLLYMWQIEDLIRANDLDIDKIKKSIIEKTVSDPETLRAMEEWYESLIDMMRREDVAKAGHLQMNKNIIGALADLNKRLLADPKFADYQRQFYDVLPIIVELRAKSGDNPAGEIETCFNALYGLLTLRLKGAEVSAGTIEAVNKVAKFIAMLAHYYALDEKDELFNDEKDDATGKK
ncbi:MAG: DUF4924 family protein [Muribaculaceae bacterium]|nr:DUF4924 family protein [Muribaculaceae bacterium]